MSKSSQIKSRTTAKTQAYRRSLQSRFVSWWASICDSAALAGWRKLGRWGRLSFLLAVLVFGNISALLLPHVVDAAPVSMYLFWDPSLNGTTLPTGWSATTTIHGQSSVLGRFPYGEDPLSNRIGWTGGDGTRPFTPTVASVTVDPPASGGYAGGGNTTVASGTHIHPAPAVTVGADNNGDASNPDLPAFRSLELMEYNGIPTIIPAGAIALFTQLPATGWTQYSQENNKMVMADSTVHSGGGDTVSNSVTFGALAADSTNASGQTLNLFANQATAPLGHTHAAPPAVTSCQTGCTGNGMPPYVQPILGMSTSSLPAISVNLIAMFDGDPGGGWTVLSAAGGPFYHEFIRGASTASLSSLGSATHTPAAVASTAPATTAGNGGNTVNIGGNTVAALNHTHLVHASFNSVSNLPPYFNIVYAEKVSFILQHYAWYVDPVCSPGPCSTDVTDRWPSGALDVAQDSPIVATPTPYQPPVIGTQLRLRIQLLVGAQPLAANSVSFKLQYAPTSAADCITGNWRDVSDAGSPSPDWIYGTDNITDGSALNASNSVFGSNVMEVFSKSATSATSPNAAGTGQTVEYDWLISDSLATGGTEYHFRPIQTDGQLLGQYNGTNDSRTSKCPDLVTAPTVDQEMRHGEFFQTNAGGNLNSADPDKGFAWVE